MNAEFSGKDRGRQYCVCASSPDDRDANDAGGLGRDPRNDRRRGRVVSMIPSCRAPVLALAVVLLLSSSPGFGHAEEPVALAYSRQELQDKWRARVQSFLDDGVIPLIDLESSLRREDGERFLAAAMDVMDELGIALVAFDGYEAPKDGKTEGYRWGYYVHRIANAYPDRIVLATNGGTNTNWLSEKGGRESDFIDQMEVQVRSGDYPIMGEFDVRHYMSGRQCRKGRTDRDSDIPLNGENGHRLFRLSEGTGSRAKLLAMSVCIHCYVPSIPNRTSAPWNKGPIMKTPRQSR